MMPRYNPLQSRAYNGVSPWSDLDSLIQDIALPTRSFAAAVAGFPSTDIFETENALQLKVDLPGHDPKTMNVKLEGDKRTEEVPKEGRYHQRGRNNEEFNLSFSLPKTVDGADPEARFDAGVLTVTLPKREESKPRSIEVKVQGP